MPSVPLLTTLTNKSCQGCQERHRFTSSDGDARYAGVVSDSEKITYYRVLPFLLGFAMPWRMTLDLFGRATHLAAFDLIFPFALVILIAWRVKRRELFDAARRNLPALGIAAIAAAHAAGLITTRGNHLTAMATSYAILAGLALTFLNRDTLLSGLRAGLAASVVTAVVAGVLRPEIVHEGRYFAAWTGAKNTLAFLVGVTALTAFARPNASRARCGMEVIAWFALLALINARAAVIATTIGFTVEVGLTSSLRYVGAGRVGANRDKTGGNRSDQILVGILVLGALLVLFRAALPWDRIEFAQAIITYATDVPLFGFGPGFGYGLDLYLKTFLELGAPGAACLIAMIFIAIRRCGPTPGMPTPILAFALILGLAHDPMRWPLFWLLLLSDDRGQRVDRDGEENGVGLSRRDLHKCLKVAKLES